MSNFKSGSGNLSFGGDSDSTEEGSERKVESESSSDSSTDAKRPAKSPSAQATQTEDSTEHSLSSTRESVASEESTSGYPYFVRRRNVGDERDVRLEIFLRDKVADKEGQFRSELAECLGTNEVSKTDAREFALLSAFQDPEGVAKMMKEEGYGTFD
jgi:hypothetical protein